MSELIAPWGEIGRVAVSSLAIYCAVLLALRLAGRRTISQMSAFDVVVTVAIGSLIATTILSPDANFTLGMTAIVVLLVAQQVVAALRQRMPAARRWLDFAPETLYDDEGLALRKSPLAAQVTEAEVLSKLRQKGYLRIDDTRLIILEPDGKISVFPAKTTDS